MEIPVLIAGTAHFWTVSRGAFGVYMTRHGGQAWQERGVDHYRDRMPDLILLKSRWNLWTDGRYRKDLGKPETRVIPVLIVPAKKITFKDDGFRLMAARPTSDSGSDHPPLRTLNSYQERNPAGLGTVLNPFVSENILPLKRVMKKIKILRLILKKSARTHLYEEVPCRRTDRYQQDRSKILTDEQRLSDINRKSGAGDRFRSSAHE